MRLVSASRRNSFPSASLALNCLARRASPRAAESAALAFAAAIAEEAGAGKVADSSKSSASGTSSSSGLGTTNTCLQAGQRTFAPTRSSGTERPFAHDGQAVFIATFAATGGGTAGDSNRSRSTRKQRPQRLDGSLSDVRGLRERHEQKTKTPAGQSTCGRFRFSRAGDRIRTGDVQLGRLAFCH